MYYCKQRDLATDGRQEVDRMQVRSITTAAWKMVVWCVVFGTELRDGGPAVFGSYRINIWWIVYGVFKYI